jgi:hypothetical protein
MNNPQNFQSLLTQLDHLLEEYLVKKVPSIPPNIKEAIVKFGPYIALVLTVMALPAILFVLGLGTFVMPFTFLGGVAAGTTFSITMIFSLIAFVLGALAIPGLFRRAKSAWNLLYYATLVGVVQNVITFNLGGLIIGSLLSLYILFQVRELYR